MARLRQKKTSEIDELKPLTSPLIIARDSLAARYTKLTQGEEKQSPRGWSGQRFSSEAKDSPEFGSWGGVPFTAAIHRETKVHTTITTTLRAQAEGSPSITNF